MLLLAMVLSIPFTGSNLKQGSRLLRLPFLHSESRISGSESSTNRLAPCYDLGFDFGLLRLECYETSFIIGLPKLPKSLSTLTWLVGAAKTNYDNKNNIRFGVVFNWLLVRLRFIKRYCSWFKNCFKFKKGAFLPNFCSWFGFTTSPCDSSNILWL